MFFLVPAVLTSYGIGSKNTVTTLVITLGMVGPTLGQLLGIDNQALFLFAFAYEAVILGFIQVLNQRS